MLAIMKLEILLLIFMIYIILKFSYFYIISWTSHFFFHHFSYSISSKNFFYLQWFFISSCDKNHQVLLNSHSPRKIPQSSRRYCKTIANHHKINAILEKYDISLKTCKHSSSRCLQRLLSKIPWTWCFVNFESFCKRICESGGRCSSLVSHFSLTWSSRLCI